MISSALPLALSALRRPWWTLPRAPLSPTTAPSAQGQRGNGRTDPVLHHRYTGNNDNDNYNNDNNNCLGHSWEDDNPQTHQCMRLRTPPTSQGMRLCPWSRTEGRRCQRHCHRQQWSPWQRPPWPQRRIQRQRQR